MRPHLLVACLLGISITAFNQKNFTPAIIVKNNGDSLSGKIDYRNWKKNPDIISFTGSSNQVEELNPQAISGFYIINEKERYLSYDVSIDQSSDQYTNAFSGHLAKADVISKRVFLLQLINDPALSLFQYNDGVRNNFYYRMNGSKPVGLIYHFLYVEEGDQVQTNDSYRQQLSVLFSSCPPIVKKTRALDYSAEALKDIFGDYLRCTNPSNAAEIKKKDAMPIKFGVVAGAMYNTYKFKGTSPRSQSNYSSLSADNYKSNLSPVIGVSLDIGLKRNANKFHLVNELIYKRYATSDTIFTHTILYDYTNKISFALSYLQLNTIARYVFNTKNIVSPFINAGVGNAFMISEGKNSKHLTYTTGEKEEMVAIDGIRKYEISGLFGAGVSAGKFVVEARYAFSNGFSPYVGFKSKISSYQLIATYNIR